MLLRDVVLISILYLDQLVALGCGDGLSTEALNREECHSFISSLLPLSRAVLTSRNYIFASYQLVT